jgi:glycopeptide antibiotics resistance protein
MRIENKRVVRFLKILFFIYIFLLLGVVTLRFLNPSQLGQMRDAYDFGIRPNLIPFRTLKDQFAAFREGYAQWNILANTVCFMPFGFLLPLVTKRPRGVFAVTAAGCLFSVCIECTQFIFKSGVFDVDDIILNTVGVFIGYICVRIAYALFGKLINSLG